VAYIDEHDINKAIITAMRANGTLTALIGAGANLRLYTRTPRGVTTFPWVRMDGVEATPITGTRKGPGIEWVSQVGRQFMVFSQQTSLDEAAAVQKAIIDIMDAAPTNITLGTGTVFQSIRNISFLRYDSEFGTSMAGVEYMLGISSV